MVLIKGYLVELWVLWLHIPILLILLRQPPQTRLLQPIFRAVWEVNVAFDFLARAVRFLLLEGRGIDDGRAFFALLHLPAEFLGLFVGHPNR